MGTPKSRKPVLFGICTESIEVERLGDMISLAHHCRAPAKYKNLVFRSEGLRILCF